MAKMALDKISITAHNSGEKGQKKMNIFDSREKELWEKVKPYLVGNHLKDDAPEDVIKAEEELHKLAWENLLDSMQ